MVIILISYQVNALTELHELFRLPLLIEHFLDHKEEDNNLGLFDFLQQHYTSENNDSDSDEDEQLPFKSREDGIQHTSLSTVILPEAFDFQFQLFPPSLSYSTNYTPGGNSGAKNGIWQPPQIL